MSIVDIVVIALILPPVVIILWVMVYAIIREGFK
jgi:hypothetical protein